MEALIGISFNALNYEHPKAPDPERLSAAAAEAQARVIEEAEEWEIADEEGGDGGPPVKLLPVAETAQARAFQQGLNRAVKAEEKINRKYARSDARSRQRGDRCGGKSTTGYDEEYPALRHSIERKGEIKYHAANEKKMREKAAQDSDDNGWGWIGEEDGKAPNYVPPHKRAVPDVVLKKPKFGFKDDPKDTVEDPIVRENKPKSTPLPPQRLMARMKLLDAYDNDGEHGGVPLI